MVAARRFTATARRDGRWWVVQCVEHPGAISQVTRLDQAADVHREAIAFVAGVPEADVEVDVQVELPDDVRAALDEAEEARAAAVEADARATARRRAAAGQLADAGYSVRDIGNVLGVSFQRAHQLLAVARETAHRP